MAVLKSMAKNKIRKDKTPKKSEKLQKAKPAEIKEVKKSENKIAAKSFLDLESIEIDSTNREEAPVLEKSNEAQPTLENSVRDVRIDNKEEEKPFKYSSQSKYDDKPKRYENRTVQEPFAVEEERTLRSARRDIISSALEKPAIEWMPSRKERPVGMIQENSSHGFSEEIIKYEREENESDKSPMQSKWHDSKKDVKKYKMKSGY